MGVPPKIGKADMDGSNAELLLRVQESPLSIAVDTEFKVIYWSTENPPSVSSDAPPSEALLKMEPGIGDCLQISWSICKLPRDSVMMFSDLI